MNVRQLAARLEGVQGVPPRGSPASPPPLTPARTVFADHLRRAGGTEQAAPLKLSAHAQERIAQRGISLDEDERRILQEATDALHAKGARDALLLRADAAFVVNVPSRTVITAIDGGELRERVFTQIDSAMLI